VASSTIVVELLDDEDLRQRWIEKNDESYSSPNSYTIRVTNNWIRCICDSRKTFLAQAIQEQVIWLLHNIRIHPCCIFYKNLKFWNI